MGECSGSEQTLVGVLKGDITMPTADFYLHKVCVCVCVCVHEQKVQRGTGRKGENHKITKTKIGYIRVHCAILSTFFPVLKFFFKNIERNSYLKSTKIK